MKILYLTRHAEAGFHSEDHSDIKRELTLNGKKSAHTLGKDLVKREAKIDQICASSALRTTMTAQIIADQISYDRNNILLEKKLYETKVFVLLDFINNLEDQFEKVLLVNHNPTITDLVRYLIGEHSETMKPATIVQLTFDVNQWKHITKGTGSLVYRETF